MQDQPQRTIGSRTFSLGTMFFIVTCAAVVSAVFAFGERNHWPFWASALISINALISIWGIFRGDVVRAICWSLVTFLLLLCAPATVDRSGPRRGDPCLVNLKVIGMAFLAYEQANGSLPPAFTADSNGKPLHGWRTLILPYLDQSQLYGAFKLDRPWNDPANKQPAQVLIPWFRCPKEQSLTTQTSYLAVVGPNTAWPGSTARKLSDFKNPSKTILVIEVANSGIQWAEPRDLQIGDLTAGENTPGDNLRVSSPHRGINAVFADGHLETFRNDIDPKTLAGMFDITNPPDGPNP
jgi:hypothetical protein